MSKLSRIRAIRALCVALGVVVANQCSTHNGHATATVVTAPQRTTFDDKTSTSERKEVAQ